MTTYIWKAEEGIKYCDVFEITYYDRSITFILKDSFPSVPFPPQIQDYMGFVLEKVTRGFSPSNSGFVLSLISPMFLIPLPFSAPEAV